MEVKSPLFHEYSLPHTFIVPYVQDLSAFFNEQKKVSDSWWGRRTAAARRLKKMRRSIREGYV